MSGYGNILKAGKLFKVFKAGEKLILKSKTFTKLAIGARKASGYMEMTSGVGNALLKLTGTRETELGRKISEVLFYLEMAALTGEITAALHGSIKRASLKAIEETTTLDKIRKKAQKIVDDATDKKTKEFLEAQDDLAALRQLEEFAGVEKEMYRKVSDLFDSAGGRLLGKKELNLLKDYIWTKYKVRLRLVDVDHRLKAKLGDWNKRGVVGSFRKDPPPELFLRSSNASELTVFHEMVHLEYWYLKKTKVHFVQEEIVVFDEIWKTKKRWTSQELLDSYYYVIELLKESDLSKDLLTFRNSYGSEIRQIQLKLQYGIK